MFPIVGDAIVSAIIGFVDPEWSVRNSGSMVFSAAMSRVVDADKNAVNSDSTSKNAIALSELFRSYPALCGVLFAVLNACVNGNLKVHGGGSLPPILPILVLLYRVQPLDVCDQDVVEHMQMFCTPIIDCLGHSDLSVRQAAARALCNLSGGDDDRPLSVSCLYSHCIAELQKPSGWNKVHGVLLLLKELRLSKRITEEDSHVKLLNDLLQTSSQGLAAPPICLVDSIHILETIEDAKRQEVLAQICFGIIWWLSQDTRTRLELPGMSELCASAAHAAVSWVAKKIFQRKSIDAVGELSCLLECTTTDVRMPAIKRFKKLIYDGLDSMVIYAKQDSIGALAIVHTLGTAVAAALTKELNNDNPESAGTHPPTLRRLSRCLLEIEAARRRISPSTQTAKSYPLRQLGLSILDRAQLETDNTTPLVGNAVELVSADFHEQDMDRLWPLLGKLSQASLPWRLRYSVACASARLWQDHRSLRPKLRYLASRLLQDEDPDARYILVSSIIGGTSCTLPVSEHVLTNFIREHESGLDDAQLFMDHLVGRAQQALTRLHRMIQERASDAQRKIFEEEDPNSYHEPSAEDQATLSSLWENLSTNQSLMAQHKVLCGLATEILTIISNRDDADILTCAIFTTLHSLLLVTTATTARPALTEAANRLRSKCSTTTPLHPSLENVLCILSERNEEPLQRDQIQQCLFLLSENRAQRIT